MTRIISIGDMVKQARRQTTRQRIVRFMNGNNGNNGLFISTALPALLAGGAMGGWSAYRGGNATDIALSAGLSALAAGSYGYSNAYDVMPQKKDNGLSREYKALKAKKSRGHMTAQDVANLEVLEDAIADSRA
jgi:hypothetical protein